jgi:hypothetical protein
VEPPYERGVFYFSKFREDFLFCHAYPHRASAWHRDLRVGMADVEILDDGDGLHIVVVIPEA